ncbi:WD40 repeat domain-containing protein [Chloropicon primus]|nr:WD40 repeat domain-containing protein [Chloropicon primus]
MGQENNPPTPVVTSPSADGRNGNGNGRDHHGVHHDNDDSQEVRHLHPDATRTLDVALGMPLSGCRYKCTELVRVMEQALYSLGYPDVAKHLENSSGVDLHSDRVRRLQEGCLSGEWEMVIRLIDTEKMHLFGLDSSDVAEGGASPQVGLEERVQKAKFLILEQKYLECLSSGDVQQALQCLREEITPLGINMPRLHELASLMRCRSWMDLMESKAWGEKPSSSLSSWGQSSGKDDGLGHVSEGAAVVVNNGSLGRAGGSSNNNGTSASGGANPQVSRQQLLRKLQEVIPSSVMLPENRLESLLGQAVANQISQCMYYNKTDTTFSLLSDYSCGPEQIPSVTCQVLDGHSDEVWHIQFSSSGQMLASASADGTCIIWDYAPSEASDLNGGGSSSAAKKKFKLKHELLGHKKPIAFVCWSPNDKYLLTCGNDHVLNAWDVETGRVFERYEKHTDSVTSCAWLPDSKRFVSGSIDKHIYMWHLDGRCIRHWKGSRINDLAISRNGKWMVSTSNEKKFHLFNLVMDTETIVQEQESIISLCLSKHSDLLLVNLQNQKIHLWDLNEFFECCGTPDALPTEPVRRYRGQHEKQGRYVIRSCFGGSNETFVVSGSEDSQVYIWHQQKGELLKVLSGHSGTVNAVTWNPADPYTFASASDDHSIRIWGTSEGGH